MTVRILLSTVAAQAARRSYIQAASTASLASSFPSTRSSEPPILVVSGPSGAGKSTLLRRLLADHPKTFGFSVSHTTRSPRPVEKHGIDYNFVNTAAFSNLLSQGAFLEHAAFAGSLYGTSLKAIKDLKAQGLVPVLDLELNGVKRVAEIMSGDKAKFALVLPPNLEVLEQRLRGRATETDEVVRKRLDRGRKEMERMLDAGWDLKVVNDNPEEAYRQLEAWALGIVNKEATSGPIPEVLEKTGAADNSVVG